MEERICPKCGFVSRPDNRFCQTCGTLLMKPVSSQITPESTDFPGEKEPQMQKIFFEDTRVKTLEEKTSSLIDDLRKFSIELKDWRSELAAQFLSARKIRDQLEHLRISGLEEKNYQTELDSLEKNLDRILKWFEAQSAQASRLEYLRKSIQDANKILTEAIGHSSGIENDIKYSIEYIAQLKKEISNLKEISPTKPPKPVAPITAKKDITTKEVEQPLITSRPGKKKIPRKVRKGERVVSFRFKAWLAELSLVYFLAFGGVLILSIGLFMGVKFVYDEYVYSIIYSKEHTTETILRLLGLIALVYALFMASLLVLNSNHEQNGKRGLVTLLAYLGTIASSVAIVLIIGLATYGVSGEGMVPLLFYLGLLPMIIALFVGNQKLNSSILSLLLTIGILYYIVEATTSQALLEWLNGSFNNSGRVINATIVFLALAFFFVVTARQKKWVPVFIYSLSIPLVLIFAQDNVVVPEILVFLLPLINLRLFAENNVDAPPSFQHFMFSISTLLSNVVTLVLIIESSYASSIPSIIIIGEFSALLFGYFIVFWMYLNKYQLLEISFSIPISIDLESDQLIFRRVQTRINGIIIVNNFLIALGAIVLGIMYYSEISVVTSLLIAAGSAYMRVRKIDESVKYGTLWNVVSFEMAAFIALLAITPLSLLHYLGTFLLFEAIVLSADEPSDSSKIKQDLYLLGILGFFVFVNAFRFLDENTSSTFLPLLSIVLFYSGIVVFSLVKPFDRVVARSRSGGLILVLGIQLLASLGSPLTTVADHVFFNAALVLLLLNAWFLFVLSKHPERIETIRRFLLRNINVEEGGVKEPPFVPLQQALFTLVLTATILVSSWLNYYQEIAQYGGTLMTVEVMVILGLFVAMLSRVPSEYKREMIKPIIVLEGSLIAGILGPLALALFGVGDLAASAYIDALSSSSVFSSTAVLFLAISWILSIAISVSFISETSESTSLVRPLWSGKETDDLRRTEISMKEAGQ